MVDDDGNLFDPAVQANHPEWARRKREAQIKRLGDRMAETLPKLNSAEADMRRAFRRWEKYRALADRLEKQIDKLEGEKFREGSK